MKVLGEYSVVSENVPAKIIVSRKDEEYIDSYEVIHTTIKEPTRLVLDYLKEKIIETVDVKISELLDPRQAEEVKKKIVSRTYQLINSEFQGMTDSEKDVLVGRLIQDMLGLGELEFLFADDFLEEVVVNGSTQPAMVYHKKYGWLKTNVFFKSEEQIHNYSSIIGRRVGKQITNLNPLMDAHLLSGSRVNATLMPISSKGNTITVRKFAKDPWTIVNLIDPKLNTLTSEAAALFWLAMQYEMSMIVAGGTGSGKTSFLNAILLFCPPTQRILSIEDTRELVLPDFLHWVPMTTRQPNPEGKGGVEMLDLMVNSLRMRPDRIVLGETRRQKEAEVLFEAMHTGHSVYSTLHADDASQARTRLISPPINVPETVLSSLQLMVVQYRQRRTGIRRTYEVAEIVPGDDKVSLNLIYKWDPRTDRLQKVGDFVRMTNELTLHTGFSQKEIAQDLKEKESILDFMLKNNIRDVNSVGRVVAWYYRDKDYVLNCVKSNKCEDLLKK
ncbi:CpaF family protein [Candidatus Micrarchaeota archaeon]|nr:CpaF family protein [Candidatus Micrarchaeota archaeon]